jgi:hypothetical protein
MNNRPETISQNLKVFLSDRQKLHVAEALAQTLHEKQELEDHKKAATHEMAERLEGMENSIKKSARLLSQGYDFQWVECRVLYNTPQPGEKQLIRLDTGEEVRIEEMTFEEAQENLPLTEPTPAAPPEAAAVPPEEPLSLTPTPEAAAQPLKGPAAGPNPRELLKPPGNAGSGANGLVLA